MTSEIIPTHQFKVLMVGDSGVGKSSLVHRYANDQFTPNFLPTIGIDYKIKTMTIEDNLGKRNIRLAVWDSAGQERFRNITKQYFRGAHGMVLVYDCSDRASFDNVTNWLYQIEQSADSPGCAHSGAVITLVANKCDCALQAVSDDEGQSLADERNIRFFKTSAKSNINVSEMFLTMVLDIERHMMARKALGIDGGSSSSSYGRSISLGKVYQKDAFDLSNRNAACCGGVSSTTVPLS